RRNGLRGAQALQELPRQRPARFLVTRRNDAHAAPSRRRVRRLRLAEVVGKDGKGKDGTGRRILPLPLRKLGQRIQAMAAVHEDVALGMPLLILWGVLERA